MNVEGGGIPGFRTSYETINKLTDPVYYPGDATRTSVGIPCGNITCFEPYLRGLELQSPLALRNNPCAQHQTVNAKFIYLDSNIFISYQETR